MRLTLTFISALIIATGLAYLVHIDPGFVLLTYGNISIETSLAVLVFLILISFIIAYLGLRIFFNIKKMPKALTLWRTQHKQSRSQRELNDGLIDAAEGHWKRSEKRLLKHASQSATPLLNYISAAQAAQSQGAYERRDQYLVKATKALPAQTQAIQLMRAELQFSAGQLEQALASLQQLHTDNPTQPAVLVLLMKTYHQLKDWEALHLLLPSIRAHKMIAIEQWKSIESDMLTHLFNKPGLSLTSLWNTLDKGQKTIPAYAAAYAESLIQNQQSEHAESILLKSLHKQVSSNLLRLYGLLDIDRSKKIQQLEKWLKKEPSHINMLNLLGQLCLQQGLLGKAKGYLDKSLSIKASTMAYLLMGHLHEKQDHPAEQASRCYKSGLELSLDLPVSKNPPSLNGPGNTLSAK